MTLPRFVGIGALKAGTTLAHDLLAEHPDVVMAAHRKEVMFFDHHWDRGVAWYASHWPDPCGGVPGEVTPGYLFHPEAAARMAAVVPEARLFAVLRDPVERAWSQYRFFVKEQGFRGSVEDFLAAHPNAVARGLYDAQLRRFRDHFPEAQLAVVLFEDLVARPRETMATLYGHVGVDPAFVPPSLGQRRNASEVPRWHRLYTVGRRGVRWLYDHDLGRVVDLAKRAGLRRVFLSGDRADAAFQPMTADTRRRLADAYRADADALGAHLGRDLGAVWRSLAP